MHLQHNDYSLPPASHQPPGKGPQHGPYANKGAGKGQYRGGSKGKGAKGARFGGWSGDSWCFDWVCNNCSRPGYEHICHGSYDYCYYCWGLKEQTFSRNIGLEDVVAKGDFQGSKGIPNRFNKGAKGDKGARWPRIPVSRKDGQSKTTGEAKTETKAIKALDAHVRGLQAVLGENTPEVEAVISIAQKRKESLLLSMAPQTRVQRAKTSVGSHQKNLREAQEGAEEAKGWLKEARDKLTECEAVVDKCEKSLDEAKREENEATAAVSLSFPDFDMWANYKWLDYVRMLRTEENESKKKQMGDFVRVWYQQAKDEAKNAAACDLSGPWLCICKNENHDGPAKCHLCGGERAGFQVRGIEVVGKTEADVPMGAGEGTDAEVDESELRDGLGQALGNIYGNTAVHPDVKTKNMFNGIVSSDTDVAKSVKSDSWTRHKKRESQAGQKLIKRIQKAKGLASHRKVNKTVDGSAAAAV